METNSATAIYGSQDIDAAHYHQQFARSAALHDFGDTSDCDSDASETNVAATEETCRQLFWRNKFISVRIHSKMFCMYQARAVSNAGSIARVMGKPSWRYARGTQSATLCRANIHEIRFLCKIVQEFLCPCSFWPNA